MPMRYKGIDTAMVKSIDMVLEVFADRTTDPSSASYLAGIINTRFPFQFPPRVTGDSKTAKWKLSSETKSYEDFYIWDGAEPRQISIEATYIVDGDSWSGDRIDKIAKGAKAYFYTKVLAKSAEDGASDFFIGPIVRIRSLYGSVRGESTWRMESANVSHGDTMIEDDGGFFPLMTKITFDLKSWTKIGDIGRDPGEGILDGVPLEVRPSVTWF